MKRLQRRYTVHRYLTDLARRSAEGRPAEGRPAVPHESDAISDRVVRVALDQTLVSWPEVQRALEAYHAGGPEHPGARLWRVLARQLPERAEALREISAMLYGFEEETVSTSDAVAFIRGVYDRFDDATWDRLIEAAVIPIRVRTAGRTQRLVFVSPDPSRLELQSLLHDVVDGPFDLRYTPAASVAFLMGRIIPLLRGGSTPAPSAPKTGIITPETSITPLRRAA